MFLDLIATRSIFFSIEFSKSFQHLKNVLPLEKLLKTDLKTIVKKSIFWKAANIYAMEGYTYQIFKHRVDENIFFIGDFQYSLFSFGIYNHISKLIDYRKDFFHYETQLNTNQLNQSDLKRYISSLFPKDHLEKMQNHYTLAKLERVNKGTIKKLVVTNPYTKGLKNLMYAFVEEDPKKKINYFETGISNLEHIKYYYIEGIYFYAKYLKEIDHDDFQKWFDKGFDMADRYHYRFLKHQFLNLKTGSNQVYDETKYPFPDELDVEAYIEKYNKYWSDEEKESPKK